MNKKIIILLLVVAALIGGGFYLFYGYQTERVLADVEAVTADGYHVTAEVNTVLFLSRGRLMSGGDLPKNGSLGFVEAIVRDAISGVNMDEIVFYSGRADEAVVSAIGDEFSRRGYISMNGDTIWDALVDIRALPEECKRYLTERLGADSAPAAKIILLGMDGIDWNVVDALVAQGRLPNVKRMMDSGAYGNLRSFEPTLSPLIWTTMATGRMPEDHGILDFVKVDAGGEVVPVNSTHRYVPAFWQIASWSGRKVGVVDWLASWPAEEVNGFEVTDRLILNAGRREDENDQYSVSRTWPPGLTKTVAPMIEGPLAELDGRLYSLFNLEAPGAREMLDDFDRRTNRVKTARGSVFQMLAYREIALQLLESEKPELLAVYFATTDTMAHQFMEFAPPRRDFIDEKEYAVMNDVVNRVYEMMDETIGMFLNAAGDEYNVMVISDHGFKSGDVRPKESGNIEGTKAAAWHRINGVLLASGPDIAPGAIKGASVKDITPTLLFAMDVPIAENMVGRPIAELFAAELRTKLENVEMVSDYDKVGSFIVPERTAPSTPEEDQAALDQLKQLGYLGGGSSRATGTAGAGGADQIDLSTEAEGGPEEGGSEFDPDTASVSEYCNLATRYMNEGHFSDAEAMLNQAKLMQPESLTVMSTQGALYLKMGRFAEAKNTFEVVVSRQPREALSHVNLGVALLELKQYVEAERELLVAVGLDPGVAEAWNNLALIAYRTKRLQDAVEYYNKSIALDDGVASTHLNMGIAYWELQDFEGAARALEMAFELDRKYEQNVKLLLAAGVSLYRTGKLDAAEKRLRAVLEIKSDTPMVHSHLGLIAMDRGDRETAISEFETELKINPNDKLANDMLLQLQAQ